MALSDNVYTIFVVLHLLFFFSSKRIIMFETITPYGIIQLFLFSQGESLFHLTLHCCKNEPGMNQQINKNKKDRRLGATS